MLNFYRNFSSMRYKLGLVIGISTFLISTILIAYTTKSARDQAVKAARENAMAIAKDFAGQVKADIEKGVTSSNTLAQAFAGVKAEEHPLTLNRDEANTILKEVLSQNDAFYGAYTCWEPNAFDGQDELFVGLDAAHDTSGRFIPYWFKEDGNLLLETTQGYSKDPYYVVPLQTKAEAVMDPVNYTVNGASISLITIASPIMYKHNFYGVAGVDIALNWMQNMVKSAKLYDGQAKVNIISHNGSIAASTIHDTLVGKNLKAVFPEYDQQIADLASGTEGSILSDSTLKVHAPIFIGKSSTPWQISITIPSELILAEANAQMWQMILIGTALLVVSLLIILVVIQRLIKPLDAMVHVTEKVAEGDLAYQEIKAGNDEIGQMSKAFSTLMEGLRKTTDFANQIGSGNLEAEFTALSDKDVLGNALLTMRNSLKKIAEEDKKRNWVTEGLATFSDILRRNNSDVQQLSESILTSLVKYLGANQGGMFVVTEEGGVNYLDLTAMYAWDRKRIRATRLNINEGLAGQAVLEREPIYLTDVPQDYIAISSGLGDANPSAILIMPLIINNEVMGVLELASFKEFEQYQIDFIAKIGESIASTLSTARINETTRRLLDESRTAAEEKRAAEEELLQNQEELQATQEEMQRTINELREENRCLQMGVLGLSSN
jgi:methyl-accepting chemotaxis protein